MALARAPVDPADGGLIKARSRGVSKLGNLLPFAAGTAGQAKASGDTYSVQWENDRIAKTDRHYTNGFRLSWVSEEKASDPEWVRDLLNRIYPFAALKTSNNAGDQYLPSRLGVYSQLSLATSRSVEPKCPASRGSRRPKR